jgi:hypothetical protein
MLHEIFLQQAIINSANVHGKQNLRDPGIENNIRNARIHLKINTKMKTAVAIENNLW